MSQPDLIIHDEKDNVGVVVIETTKKGQDCSAWIMENDKTVNIHAVDEIQLGHKIAMVDVNKHIYCKCYNFYDFLAILGRLNSICTQMPPC